MESIFQGIMKEEILGLSLETLMACGKYPGVMD